MKISILFFINKAWALPCVSSVLMLFFILCGDLTKVFSLVFVFSRLFLIRLTKILFIVCLFCILTKIVFDCFGRPVPLFLF